MIASSDKLTPNGLSNVLCSSDDDESIALYDENSPRLSLEKMLSKKSNAEDSEAKYKYKIFCLNGKDSHSLIRVLTLTKGYEMHSFL
jgi:hypothetical protein